MKDPCGQFATIDRRLAKANWGRLQTTRSGLVNEGLQRDFFLIGVKLERQMGLSDVEALHERVGLVVIGSGPADEKATGSLFWQAISACRTW